MCERVDDDKVVCLLELYSGVPHLIGWHLLQSFLGEPSVEPEVEGLLLKVQLDADNSGGCCPELLSDLLLLTLIRYADLYIIIIKV